MSSGGLLDAQFRDTARVGAFVQFGETVTHTAPKTPGVAAVATVITAVRVGPLSASLASVGEGDLSKQCRWIVAAADLAAPPDEGDTITDDAGQLWGVIHALPQEGGVFQLTCIHAEDR